jgi:hypothetical protein
LGLADRSIVALDRGKKLGVGMWPDGDRDRQRRRRLGALSVAASLAA